MIYTLYIAWCIPQFIFGTVLAKPLSPILGMFVDDNGDLPWWLSWFQPAETKCWGDQPFWDNQMPLDDWYARSVVWLFRNSGQGFDQWLGRKIMLSDPVTTKGDITIGAGSEWGPGKYGWFLVQNTAGYFHFRICAPADSATFVLLLLLIPFYPVVSAILSVATLVLMKTDNMCALHEFGWRLQGIAAGEAKPICKQYVFTPIRFKKFIRGV